MPLYFYPQSAKEKIGFKTIIEKVASLCLSEAGKAYIENKKVSTEAEEISTALQQTAEFKDLMQFDDAFPLTYLPNVDFIFSKAAIEGNYLSPDEFYTVLNWMRLIKKVVAYFKQRTEKYPELCKLLQVSTFDLSFIKKIEQIINDEGQLRPDASPELARIRRHLNETSASLRQVLQRILREARQEGWADDKDLTLRNERLVIPIKTDFKGKVKGLVQDLSASGQTVYIEPLEALGLNNEIRELHIRERNEVIRILTALTDKMRPHLLELDIYQEFITQIDVLRAKALFAIQTKAILPQFEPEGKELSFIDARHPLLILQKGYDSVIPMTFKLDSEKRIMVISGPNAGGKSVSLQNAGLLVLMLQSGMLVPVKENSVFRLFTSLFVDIGDDQSIQNDLSTYTSHLSIMVKMLKGMSRKSLFLIDEFGTGTDPKMGGAIAEALLEEFVKAKSMGIITTHYSNLKEYANKSPNTSNASMRFDLASITPTYQLEQGLPGSSYAFDIATRVGIPLPVIEKAKSLVGESGVEIERLLTSLKKQSETVDRLQREQTRKNTELDQLIKKNQDLENEAKVRKNKIIQQTRESASEYLRRANILIEETVEEIRKELAEKNVTASLRKKLNQVLTNPDLDDPNLKPEAGVETEFNGMKLLHDEEVKVGDSVKFDHSAAVGRVVEMNGKRAVINVGELRMTVKTKDLIKVQRPNEPQSLLPIPPPKTYVSVDRSSKTPHQLDLRGMRVEQAMEVTTKFMDDVILAGLPEAIILHGKGTGALRASIRQHLKSMYRQIERTEDAPDNQGGTGITIVKMKY